MKGYPKSFCRSIKIIALFLSLVLLLPVCETGFADSSTKLSDRFSSSDKESVQYHNLSDEKLYSEAIDTYKAKGYSNAEHALELTVAGDIPTDAEIPFDLYPGLYHNNKNYVGPAIKWDDSIETIEWKFEVPESRLYNIEIDYVLFEDGDTAERILTVDGKQSFKEVSKISFFGAWCDETTEPILDANNDEVTPQAVFLPKLMRLRVHDSLGFYPEPIQFYFDKGSHTISLEFVTGGMYITAVRLIPPDTVRPYTEIEQEYQGLQKQNEPDKLLFDKDFQAESSIYEKSSASIRRTSSGDPATTPKSIKNIRLNVVSTSKYGQTITWELDVPQNGYYKIALRVLQNGGDGLPSFRQFMIDGCVPCRELLEFAIPYSRNWQTIVLGEGEERPYLFYLEKGIHTLSMSVVMGRTSQILSRISQDAAKLSSLLLKISMITGPDPDVNYNYKLEEKVPEMLDSFKELSAGINAGIEFIKQYCSKTPTIVNSFKEHISVLEKLVLKPRNIPYHLSDLENILSSLNSYYLSLQNQSLTVDLIKLASRDVEIKNISANIFQNIAAFFENLISSFFKDYNNIGGIAYKDAPVLTVWTGRGRDWAESMKQLIERDFSKKHKIAVKLNILPSNQLSGSNNMLMLSINAGTAPDVVTGVNSMLPLEFAFRGAIADLTQFDGFEEMKKSYLDEIFVPFKYRDKIYALPETMGFTLLYYRKDILSSLGLALPDTWEDVYNEILPILYQNDMEMYVPSSYEMFLYQYGGGYYNEDGTKSGLNTKEAYQSFRALTELYTNYEISYTADFYNRFRMGQMPIGISGSSLYFQLQVAAPELAGKWGVTPIPGTVRENGKIDRSYAGLTVDGVSILSSSTMKNEAWEFVSWWLSEDVQKSYARDIETKLGISARWLSANKEVFLSLAWDRNDLEIIKSQWKWAKETPYVLGGYFTSRHVTNAFNRVVISKMNVRESLEQAVEDINKELENKQKKHNYQNVMN